jgi:hypothetical protein
MPEQEEPIQEEYEKQMYAVGRAIDEFLNPDGNNKTLGFAILMFKLGEPADGDRMNYLCNSRREDMIAAMKEFIARNEGRYEEKKNPAVKQ